MVKKFKQITYEKDNDDHYVVVLNPWTNGHTRRTQQRIDWIGAWLRIVFRKPSEKNIVQNIYTVDTRSEVIARISPAVDVEIGLGLHRWSEFMSAEDIAKIRRQTKVDLSDALSYIFVYNWTRNGDPAERQWTEWFPRQDDIPPDIMVKRQYPYPEWSEIPSVDERLRALLVPMRRMSELDDDIPLDEFERRSTGSPELGELDDHEGEAKPKGKAGQVELGSLSEEPRRANDSASAFQPYQPPLHLQPQSSRPRVARASDDDPSALAVSKMDKADPYEEEDAAQANLNTRSVKQEILEGIKAEAEDSKPDTRNAEYRPSHALSSAISQLHGDDNSLEPEERKPIVKSEADDQDVKPNVQSSEYRPSNALAAAISQLHDGTGYPEPVDRKPIVKSEEYTPTPALHDAFVRFSAVASQDTDQVDMRRQKRDRQDGGVPSNSNVDEMRANKRVKAEPTTTS